MNSEKFLESLGATNVKYLASGSFCAAFSCVYKGKELVAKITSSKQDYNASKFFGFYRKDIPKNLQDNFTKYFYYAECRKSRKYVVFVEKLEKMDTRQWRDFHDCVFGHRVPKKKTKRVHKSIEFLREQNFVLCDMHSENIMMRGEEYVINDVGHFEIPKDLKKKYKDK
jgi:hypothetical protein